MTKILLVEDNELNRDMLSRRLERRGFKVVLACDGRHGILTARSECPDLILMDLSLPEIDGWQAIRFLKARPDTAGIPILVLTAHAMISDRERALHAGCDGFACKPVDFDSLLNKINSLLNRKASTYDHDNCQTVVG
jgi:two-component system cell cycle response regulator DivK